jgi:hypothetical protein
MDISLKLNTVSLVIRQASDSDAVVSNLELEDGDDMLLESGDFILLE